MENVDFFKSSIINVSNAKKALSLFTNEKKNEILLNIADEIEKNIDDILFRNDIDVQAAKASHLSKAFVDRLKLNESRIKNMADSVRKIASLDDPIGEIIDTRFLENGLKIEKKRVPLGTIGIIYESRPNVTIDAIALCIKSGNTLILKGGKEAINSNQALVNLAISAIKKSGVMESLIFFLNTSDREILKEILKMDQEIDVIIPRGSQEMINNIKEISKIPVIMNGKGLCHTYIDSPCDINMAVKIVKNAKFSHPAACNSLETLLIHRDMFNEFFEKFLLDLDKNNIFSLEMRFEEEGLEKLKALKNFSKINKAITSNIKLTKEKDWELEYLDTILSIKIVSSLDEAINHIAKYSSGHSEAIITSNNLNAEKFLDLVDAASVYHNTSTRFTDGGCFGMGAEIGISTQKLYSRGPMGVKELTSHKYVIHGNGQVRE